jgi:phage baseplate assembly protein W
MEMVNYNNKTYRDTNERLLGYIKDIEALKQSIKHILTTEKGAYEIYPSDYGVSLNKYIGLSFDFLEAGIERDIREAIIYDVRVISATMLELTQIAKHSAFIKFRVDSVLGSFTEEVTVGTK